MEREELEQIYHRTDESERLSQYLNAYEAFTAIHDEALHFMAVSDNLTAEVHEVLDRIVALARYRFDIRTEVEIERTKPTE